MNGSAREDRAAGDAAGKVATRPDAADGGLSVFARVLAAFGLVSLVWAGAPVLAAAAAGGNAVLTATGAIAPPKSEGGGVDFDLAALEAMPSTTFVTNTPWTKGPVAFTGVPLKDFLAAAGARGRTLHCVALNDYAIDIPASDAVAGGPIIAYASGGKPMSVRDKGPLWIVYPYDSRTEYRNETIYSRSIWQLRRIDVLD